MAAIEEFRGYCYEALTSFRSVAHRTAKRYAQFLTTEDTEDPRVRIGLVKIYPGSSAVEAF
jgi:hypothetical protein